MDTYEYGFNNGFEDGMIAGKKIVNGDMVNHGGLLGANDPYAIGYRKGFNQYRTNYYNTISSGIVILPNGEIDHGYSCNVFRHDNYQHPESISYQNIY